MSKENELIGLPNTKVPGAIYNSGNTSKKDKDIKLQDPKAPNARVKKTMKHQFEPWKTWTFKNTHKSEEEKTSENAKNAAKVARLRKW
jgi:hypothetical protein